MSPPGTTEKWPGQQRVSRNRSCALRKTDDADARDFRALLRARRERRRAAEQHDEVAPFHVGHGGVLPPLCANEGHGCPVGGYHGADGRSLGNT
jgi:hypothetical protein